MMLDWNNYRTLVQGGVVDIAKASPDIVRGYREMSNAGHAKNVLGAKTRELIALAVAVTRQCDGCITIHMKAAIDQGATRDEIIETLGVAVSVNAGAALVFSTRAMDAYAAIVPAAP